MLAFSRELLSNGISRIVNLAGMRRVLYLRDGLLYLGGSLWQRYQTDRAWGGERGGLDLSSSLFSFYWNPDYNLTDI